MNAKAISFTPDVLKAKRRALEEYGRVQTRRPVRRDWLESLGEPDTWEHSGNGAFRTFDHMTNEMRHFSGPFGAVGQLLWVRERARVVARNSIDVVSRDPCRVTLCYEVDGHERSDIVYPARLAQPRVGHCIPNGVHREGARHFLEVVDVRVERVAEISLNDARLEGIEGPAEWACTNYFALYDSLYGAGSHARDWCWVYTLKRAEP